MSNMFYDAQNFNKPIGGWNVSNVTDLGGMFYAATSFNQDLSGWDVSNVTTLIETFAFAASFNKNINNWNTSNVTNMVGTFSGVPFMGPGLSLLAGSWSGSPQTKLKLAKIIPPSPPESVYNQPLQNWNVSNVTSMYAMFGYALEFNQDLSGWNVSNVTDFSYMFADAPVFNQSLSSWDVSSATQMPGMFEYATLFNQNLGMWNISNVTNMTYMLTICGMDITNYDATLNGWAGLDPPQPYIELGADGLYYDSNGLPGRNYLVNDLSWNIVGDMYSGPPICYNKGTEILVVENGEKIYRKIEELRPGDLVDTYIHGEIPIELINSKRVVNNPSILLADEPTGNLDSKTSVEGK
jgi:surface protein